MPKAANPGFKAAPGQIRVLVVDDNRSDAELEVRALVRAGFSVEHRVADSREDFLRELHAFRPDVILSDFSMPHFSGSEALEIAREAAPDVPFIFVSGTLGEEQAIRAIKEGAIDYVLKANLLRLPAAVERALLQAREAAARRAMARELTESEAGLRRAQLMAQLAHVITRQDGSFESWSATLPELLGVSAAGMPASTRAWLEHVHPDDRAGVRAAAIEGARTGRRIEFEYRLKHADGSWSHIKQVSEPMSAAPGAEDRPRWFGTLQDISAQKRVAQSLQESEGLKGAILEASLDGVVTIDHEGRVIEFNPAAEAAFGHSREQALGKRIDELIIPPRLRAAHARGFSRFLRTGEGAILGKRIELEAMRADGTEFPVELAITAVRSGTKPVFTGFIRDLTERKRVEEDLRRFRLALDNSADIILIIDRATMRHVDVNKAACELLGYTREELLCLGPQDLLPVGRAELENAYDKLIADPSHRGGMKSYYRCRNGERLPFESTRHVFRSGDSWLITVVSRDIRQRLESEEEQRSMQQLLDNIVENIPTAVQLKSVSDGYRVMMWNKAAEQVYGVPREEAIGRNVYDLWPKTDADRYHAADLELIDSGRVQEFQDRPAQTRDRGEIRVHLRKVALFDGAGNPTHLLIVADDISERKRAERVLALEHGVARHLANANTASAGLLAAIQLICESEGWDLGRYWRVDHAAGLLRFADGWNVPGADNVGASRESREVVFAPGVGLAGKVWESGEPLWVANVGEDARVQRKDLVQSTGIRGAFVFPVAAEGEIFGVLTFSSRDIRQPDERLLAAVRVIGTQIGQFLRRKDAEEGIRRLSRVHAVLSGINAAIVRVQSRDELFKEACRVAVEDGKFRMAWIGIVERAAKRVKPVVWNGVDEEYFARMPLALQDTGPQGHGLAGRTVLERTPVVVDDMTEDPRIVLKEDARKRGFHSMVMLPLMVEGEAVGLLALYASELRFFDAAEMKLLGELAGDIAFALDHIEKQERLDYLAYYDQLTGLANRALFHERLSQHLSAAQAAGGKLAVVVADIERFRLINDSLGRQAGDELLKQIAERLARNVDRTDIARIGSDQFAIALPEVKGRSEIGRMVEELWRSCLDEPFKLGDTEVRIALKGGIALFPSDGTDADALFRTAEAAWKKAKQTGERYLFHAPEMTARVAEKLTLENKLRQALAKEEFTLHYQPKVDLVERRIVGLEALIRWNSPERGLVPPGLFIPLLEETGLILEVGEWALRRATLDHGRWLSEGVAAPRIAVNVSAIQLRQRDFVDVVRRAISAGANPTAIDVEITESLLMEDVAENIKKLKELRDMGMKISIDDFGTGYSSLGYLAKLPVHVLKIDRSFIITMLNDPDTMTLVSTIVSLAHALRLSVVAEGVEQEDQAKMLRLLRCDQMQGYLFSKPLPMEELTPLLAGKS